MAEGLEICESIIEGILLKQVLSLPKSAVQLPPCPLVPLTQLHTALTVKTSLTVHTVWSIRCHFFLFFSYFLLKYHILIFLSPLITFFDAFKICLLGFPLVHLDFRYIWGYPLHLLSGRLMKVRLGTKMFSILEDKCAAIIFFDELQI